MGRTGPDTPAETNRGERELGEIIYTSLCVTKGKEAMKDLEQIREHQYNAETHSTRAGTFQRRAKEGEKKSITFIMIFI